MFKDPCRETIKILFALTFLFGTAVRGDHDFSDLGFLQVFFDESFCLVEQIEDPTDIRDVQRIVSASKGIQELIDFDNKELFFYVERLITELKKVVRP